MRLVLLAIAAAGGSAAAMGLASSAVTLTAANLGYGAALVVASLVNRTQRQRLVPRELLGRVTSTVRCCFWRWTHGGGRGGLGRGGPGW